MEGLQETQSPMLTTLPASLEDVKLKALPDSAFYISEFITPEEEEYLLNKIASAPKPRWKQLSHRRLQTWPSDLTKDTLLGCPLPKWLAEPIIPRLHSLPVITQKQDHIFTDSPHHAPNHVLINEYLSGQGIMAHKDGSAYHPVVCTVSLGASLCLDIYGTKEDGTIESVPRWKILQEPRSLLITTDDLYTEYLHGIADVTQEINLNSESIANWEFLRSTESIKEGTIPRNTRTSLTFRDVIKVLSLGKFGMLGKC